MRPPWIHVLVVLLAIVVIACNAENVNGKSGNDKETTKPDFKRNSSFDASKSVRIHWGLPDEATVIGKLFRYPIPADAFDGTVDHYEVSEAGFSGLPSWLSWDADRAELFGVPFCTSAIDSYYIQAVAFGPPLNDTHVPFASDVFSIHVREESSLTAHLTKVLADSAQRNSQDPRSARQHAYDSYYSHSKLDCKSDEPIINVRLSFKVTSKDGDVGQTFWNAVLQTISEQFRVPLDQLRLLCSDYVLSLNAELVTAGPGWKTAAKSEVDNAVVTLPFYVTWRIGCGEQLTDSQSALLLELEQTAASNTLRSALQANDASKKLHLRNWQVVSVRLSGQRRVRQVGYSTPTPTPRWSSGATSQGRPISTSGITRRPGAGTSPSKGRRPGRRRTTTTTAAPTTAFETVSSISSYHPSTHVDDRRESTSVTAGYATPELPQTATTSQHQAIATRRPGDSPPKLQQNIGDLNCDCGTVCTFVIPQNAFVDPEDGDTRNLLLELSLSKNQDAFLPSATAAAITPLLPDAVRIDKSNLVLVAFSLTPGPYLFELAAYDSAGQVSHPIDAFVLSFDDRFASTVTPPLNHKISVTLNVSYDRFAHNVTRQIAFVNRLAGFLRDRTPEFISVLAIERGSAIVSWANNSLPGHSCPIDALRELRRRLIAPGNDTKPAYGFLTAMKSSGFPVASVQLRLSSVCQGLDQLVAEKPSASNKSTLSSVLPTSTLSIVTPRTNHSTEFEPAEAEENQFVATILPVIIIAVLLLITAIVFCYLYRRNRQAKGSKFKSDAKSEFVSKGVPVILPDEMEQAGDEPTAATPMLLKNEKPPASANELSPLNASENREPGDGSPARNSANADLSKQHETAFGGSEPNRSGSGRPEKNPGSNSATRGTSAGSIPKGQHAGGTMNPLYRPPPTFEEASKAAKDSPRLKRAAKEGNTANNV